MSALSGHFAILPNVLRMQVDVNVCVKHVCTSLYARLAPSYYSRCIRHVIHSDTPPITTRTNNFLRFNYYLNSTVTLLV